MGGMRDNAWAASGKRRCFIKKGFNVQRKGNLKKELIVGGERSIETLNHLG